MATGRPSIKARVARFTKIDAAGLPVYGACGSLVMEGFTKVDWSHEYEDGEEFIQKNAWGTLCVNDRDPDVFKNAGIAVEFCQVHADVLTMIASMIPISSGGNVVGAALTEALSEDHWALETWTRIAGSAGAPQWLYWVAPRLRPARLGSFTQEQGALLLPVETTTQPSAEEWGFGGNPYGEEPFGAGVDLPSGVHWAFAETLVPPPEQTAGCVALTDLGLS